MGKLVPLRGRRAFDAVFQRGRVYSDQLLSMRVLPNGLPYVRCGLVVGRKVGKATVRNKVKRRLREGMRRLGLRSGWDVVVVARPPAAQATYSGLMASVASLLRRAGLLLEGEG